MRMRHRFLKKRTSFLLLKILKIVIVKIKKRSYN